MKLKPKQTVLSAFTETHWWNGIFAFFDAGLIENFWPWQFVIFSFFLAKHHDANFFIRCRSYSTLGWVLNFNILFFIHWLLDFFLILYCALHTASRFLMLFVFCSRMLQQFIFYFKFVAVFSSFIFSFLILIITGDIY